jgi:cystathionine gamma-synthase
MCADKAPQTIAAATGIAADTAFGAVTPPLYLSTTYAFPAFGTAGAYDYARNGHPGNAVLSDVLTRLEGGAGAVIAASGMAAIDTLLGQLRCQDRIIAPHDCYGGTQRLMLARSARGEFNVVFVDQNDSDALAEALRTPTALVFVETPSNPLMRVVDVERVCTLAKAAGAKVAVDNTFLSPALQRPLALGADFVVHSTTKFLNGHSDVIGGAVIAANEKDVEALAAWANTTGTTGAAFDAYLTLRGIRTLFPRIERQQQTAQSIAAYLANHSAVRTVHYPGLPSHPQHAIAKRQQQGFGAILSFEIDGDLDAVRRFVSGLKLFTLAESLGGVESLIAHPITMTHASMPPDMQKAAGLSDGLLRLSIGLEAEADLLSDLEGALAAL